MAFRRSAVFVLAFYRRGIFGDCRSTAPTTCAPNNSSTTAPLRNPVRMVVLGDSLAYGTGASSRKNGYAYRVFDHVRRDNPQSTYANFSAPGRDVGLRPTLPNTEISPRECDARSLDGRRERRIRLS